MAKFDNLVEDLQKDHWELSNLAVFFKNALIISDRKKAGEILDKIDNLAKTHFEFEENYLYPRMLRLTRQVAEKLSAERSAINGFITKAKGSLKEARLHKGKISNLSKVAVLLSDKGVVETNLPTNNFPLSILFCILTFNFL